MLLLDVAGFGKSTADKRELKVVELDSILLRVCCNCPFNDLDFSFGELHCRLLFVVRWLLRWLLKTTYWVRVTLRYRTKKWICISRRGKPRKYQFCLGKCALLCCANATSF